MIRCARCLLLLPDRFCHLTGKTYVALKALRVLLTRANYEKRADKTPILIVALTNHALDQLLEGVMQFEQNIIRIGSRSESEALKSKSIYETRQRARKLPQNQQFRPKGMGALMGERDELKGQIIARLIEMRTGITLETLEKHNLATSEQIEQLRRKKGDAELQSEEEVDDDDGFSKDSHDGKDHHSKNEKAAAAVPDKARVKMSRNGKPVDDSSSSSSSGFEKVVDKKRKKIIRKYDPVTWWLDQPQIEQKRQEKKARLAQQAAAAEAKLRSAAAASAGPIPQSANAFAALEEDFKSMHVSHPPAASSGASSGQHMPREPLFTERKSSDSDDDDPVSEEDEEEVKREMAERQVDEPKVEIEIQKATQVKMPPGYVQPSAAVINAPDLFALSSLHRAHLHYYWLLQLRTIIFADLKPAIKSFEDVNKEIKEQHRLVDLHILKSAKVVGMTTHGAASQQLLVQQLKPRIIMIEEAAEVLESHILACLSSSVQHLMLIGDDKQLQPNTSHYDLTRVFKLNVSLFERLIIGQIDRRQLNTQRRMLPMIRDLSSFHYGDTIIDGPNVHYPPLIGIASPMWFFSHHHKEGGDHDEHEKINKFEAEMIVRLGIYFVNSGHAAKEITLLTTYKGQQREIRKMLKKLVPDENDAKHQMIIRTVDKYQGEENKIILLSLVRSNGVQSASSSSGHRNPMGFLNKDNRMCVALSRAKHAMIVFGNTDMLKAHNASWRTIIGRVENRMLIGDSLPLFCPRHDQPNSVRTAADFGNVPLGGCLKPCATKMPCGHVCKLVCHGFDAQHVEMRCSDPCGTVYPDCKHRCNDRCHKGAMFPEKQKDCRPCPTSVIKVVPVCGHAHTMPCHLDPALFTCTTLVPYTSLLCRDRHIQQVQCHTRAQLHPCTNRVTVTRPCGHQVKKVICSQRMDLGLCLDQCQVQLECGDVCPGKCSDCKLRSEHLSCSRSCKRDLTCGHKCRTPHGCKEKCPPCMQLCPYRCVHVKQCSHQCFQPCPPCKEPCAWKCAHHKCDRLCGEPCNRAYCLEACKKKLRCGHYCVGVCGEACPPFCRVAGCGPSVDVMDDTFSPSSLSDTESDQRFLQLECGHMFEVSALDQAMETDLKARTQEDGARAVRLPRCPSCAQVIYNSTRYGTIINDVINTLEQIKDIEHRRVEEQLEKLFRESEHMQAEARKKWMEEQKKILAAVEGSASHWFVCSNGHPYVIGECGGAMETSKCPDCNEQVGGGSHHLVNTSRPAFELGSAGSEWMPGLTPASAAPMPIRPSASSSSFSSSSAAPRPQRTAFETILPSDPRVGLMQTTSSTAAASSAGSSLNSASGSFSPSSRLPTATPQSSQTRLITESQRLREEQDREYKEALRIDFERQRVR